MTNKITNRKAFTLAEVLITIGIIGVVAAMVIPNLVHNVEEKGWTTSSAVFERKLEESLRVMNTADQLAGSQTTEEFVEKLGKYMKISKTCDNNNLNKCFKENFVDAEKHEIRLQELKTARQMAVSDYGTNTIGVQFANGVSALLAYNKECVGDPFNDDIPVMSCVSLIYDTNGTGKPNQLSKDMNTINTSNNLGVIATINGVKVTGIAKAGTYPVVDCANTDNKYCYGSKSYDNDYWAGAAQYCGGKEKMASEDELTKIAKYLYNDENLDGSVAYPNSVATTVDKDNLTKLNSYGFPNPTFSVWSSNVYSSTLVYYRYFHSTSTYRHYYSRSYSNFMAVCTKQ